MSLVTRRDFLQASLFTAAALPGVHLQAADGKPSAGANQRLRVAVLGIRGRGYDHASSYAKRPDCEVVYMCDADKEIGAKQAERLGKLQKSTPKFVADMRKIFDDKSVDIVSIATPNHWHSLAAIWAMQAGKDVYVEKPVSHNVAEGRRMVQVSRKYNRICQGGTQHRSGGVTRAVAEFIRQGKLGKIEAARCFTYRLRKPIGPAGAYEVPASVDYNLWAGPGPMEMPVRRQSFHYDWHWFWTYGNGEMGNNGIHVLDALRMVLDLKGLPRGVVCVGGRLQFNDAAETANTQLAFYDYDGLPVIEEVRNFKTAPNSPGSAFVIRGTKGLLGYSFSSAGVYDKQGKLLEKLSGGPNEDHFDNFIKAVRSRKREDQNAEIEQGHISTSLCHLANISYRLGKKAAPDEIRDTLGKLACKDDALEMFANHEKHLADNGVDIAKEQLALGPKLTVDSAKETFVGNPAADALLAREYRKPFVVPGPNEI
jgi:predicted dehydrogenase